MKLKKLALAALLSASLSAHAGGGGFAGATEPTQLLNNLELVAVDAQTMEQVQQGLQMLQNMYANTQGIPTQAWGSAQSYLQQLIQTIGQAKGITYSSGNAMAQIEQQFGNGNLLDNYQQRLTDWNGNTNNQIASVLNQFGLQANKFANTQAALDQMQQMSMTAPGRLQAIQAGNQIAGLMVNQLQDLQTVIMGAEQARLNAIAVEQNKAYQRDKAAQRFIGGVRGQY